MKDKKHLILTIIGITGMLILIFGATFAYFGVTFTNDEGITNVIVDAGDIGSISLSNPTPNLHLSLSVDDMSLDNVGDYYATNDSEKHYDTEEVQRDIAVATLTEGANDLVYKCNTTIKINLNADALASLKEGDAYVQFGGLLTDKIDLTKISSDGYSVSFYLNNDLYPNQKVTASIALTNNTANQSYLAGKNLSVSISDSQIECEVTDLEYKNDNITNNDVLAISKGNGEKLANYIIYGNSILEGENLFDVNQVANVNISDTVTRVGQEFTFDEDKTLILRAKTYNNNQYYMTKSNGVYSETISILNEKTISLPAGDTLIIYSTFKKNLAGTQLIDITTPDSSAEVQSVGDYDSDTGKYVIPISSRGKNLFDYSKVSGQMIQVTDNGLRINGYAATTPITPEMFLEMTGLKEGDKITASLNKTIVSGTVNVMFGVFMFYAKTDSGASDFYLIEASQQNSDLSVTSTTIPYGFNSNNYNNLYIYGGFNSSDGVTGVFDLYNIQVELGNTQTNYEPYEEPIKTNIYLDEPLRKVGNYTDYIDFQNKLLYRVIKKGQINADTNFSQFSNVTDYSAFYINDVDIVDQVTNGSINVPVLSSKLLYHACGGGNVNTTWSGAYQICGSVTETYNRVNFTLPNTIANKAGAISWLSSNPIDYFYPKAGAEAVSIELPDIPTFEGDSIIRIDTKTAPSTVDISYLSTP